MRVWRLTKPEHAPGLDGEGARLWGGRWNSPGLPMVYAASSLALAALEVLVHLPPQMRRTGGFPPYMAVCLDVPDDRVVPIGPASLATPRSIGDDWARARTSLALLIPSLIIPQETNLLINPAHPDITLVLVGQIDPFHFADRLGS